jgi:hypothetical protein
MGQEASVPVDGRGGIDGIDASLEEQARAPPSASIPGGIASSSATTNATSLSPMKDGSKRKLITSLPNMFQRGGGGGGSSNKDHHHNHHAHDAESYEQREAARAAAAGGNLYQRQTSDDSVHGGGGLVDDDGYSLQKLPAQPQQHGLSTVDSFSLQSTAASMFGVGVGHDPSQSFDTTATATASATASAPPDKKSIFSGRASARGVINSMRNLTIGSALSRKPKEVNDWEKQWDEDDDDSDEGGAVMGSGSDVGMSGQYATSAAAAAVSSIRPGHVDAGVMSASAILEMPPPPPPPNHATAASAAAANSAALVPPRSPPHRHHTQCFEPSANLVSPSLSPPHPGTSTVGVGGLDVWETGPSDLLQQQMLDIRKPDVDMFLPVLRVLGKGSFGKVRDVRCVCPSNM